jgi:hypothetical protein
MQDDANQPVVDNGAGQADDQQPQGFGQVPQPPVGGDDQASAAPANDVPSDPSVGAPQEDPNLGGSENAGGDQGAVGGDQTGTDPNAGQV